ncbi:hypothetical protein CCHR01_16198 [Colletotrichum chrysophilum]|uniref:Stc1 domain-containing protein n=1 Tax=Colletotrichum chrysophilum TaxID=1836956 RepID=A0AAD9A475_9PEZI|nr:hypothetical protein CCHR01_16198 [Colletotrichum chrysophilum]
MSSYTLPEELRRVRQPGQSRPGNSAKKMPESFRCDLGGEWRPWGAFSKRQQKLVTDRLSRGANINAANTGMICRQHSGEPVKEIQCEGPCNKIRILDDFSKNNRTNGVNICKHCQHWTNTQEPGYAPWAAPEQTLDPVEKLDDFEGRLPTEPSEIFNFHQDDQPLAPITGTDGVTALNGYPISTANSSVTPDYRPVARGADTESVTSSVRGAESVVSADTNRSRLEELDNGMAALWFKNAQEAQQKPKPQPQSQPQSAVVTFNAWESTGCQHAVNKTPTIRSGGSSVMGAAASAQTTRQVAPRNNAQANNVFRGQSRPQTMGGQPKKSGFGSAPDRQGDRKQLSGKEHQNMQRTLPQQQQQQRIIQGPYQDEDDEDETSD